MPQDIINRLLQGLPKRKQPDMTPEQQVLWDAAGNNVDDKWGGALKDVGDFAGGLTGLSDSNSKANLMGQMFGVPLATGMAKKGVPKLAELLNRLVEKGPGPKDIAKVFSGEIQRGSPLVPALKAPQVINRTLGGKYGNTFPSSGTEAVSGKIQLEIPAEVTGTRSPLQQSLYDQQAHYRNIRATSLKRPAQADRALMGIPTTARNKAKAALLNEDNVRMIRSMYDAGIGLDEIMVQFPQVKRGTLYDVARRASFSQVK